MPAARPQLESDRCRCNALVRWAFTEAGRRQALNYWPDEDGNVFLGMAPGDPRVLARSTPALVAKAKADGDLSSIFMPHMATCRLEQAERVPA